MAGRFRVGVVTSVHGVKGAVKVYPTTDRPERFEKLEQVEFSPNDREEDIRGVLKIASVQYMQGMVILRFKDVNSADIAGRFKGGSLWIPDSAAVPLEDDEFYIRDFLDASVVTDDGRDLGTVTDILETGANFVLEVTDPRGKQIFLPVIKECILDMDQMNHRITIHLMEGLE